MTDYDLAVVPSVTVTLELVGIFLPSLISHPRALLSLSTNLNVRHMVRGAKQ